MKISNYLKIFDKHTKRASGVNINAKRMIISNMNVNTTDRNSPKMATNIQTVQTLHLTLDSFN